MIVVKVIKPLGDGRCVVEAKPGHNVEVNRGPNTGGLQAGDYLRFLSVDSGDELLAITRNGIVGGYSPEALTVEERKAHLERSKS